MGHKLKVVGDKPIILKADLSKYDDNNEASR